MKHTHAAGVSILVPHSSFTPTPTMSPLEIAFQKGREAKRRGHKEDENPHTDLLNPNVGILSAEWLRGFNG